VVGPSFKFENHKGGWKFSRLLCVLVLITAFSAAGSIQSAVAQSSDGSFQVAQNNQGFNPFRSFFGIFKGKKEPKKTKRKTNRRRSAPAVRAAPQVVELPKDPNAGVILVVGDQMADGVADGLRRVLAEQPAVRVDRLIHKSKGLAGIEVPDWSTEILSRIRGADVEAVVVMLGRYDRREPMPGDPPIPFLEPGWDTAYLKKVQSIVATVRRERLPIVWVSLPPTGARKRNADFLALNDIYRQAAEDRRTRFVDIWDIFLSENGNYTSFGPDVDGQRRRLRSQDKIGFNWSGNQKVAFFVERELLRLLGGYGGLAFEGVEDDPNFIVLTGRTTSPEAELLGGDARTEDPDADSATYGFLVRGEALPRVEGRVDNTRLQ